MNEHDSVESGEIYCPNGQPWEMPQFTIEETHAIGAIAGNLVESGEWVEIEKRIISNVGQISLV